MKIKLLLLIATFSVTGAFAQNIFRAQIKDATTNEPLVGSTAFIEGTNNGSSADMNGIIEIKNIPEGRQIIVFEYIGYKEKQETLVFPLTDTSMKFIFLLSEATELEKVVVSATRSSRTIDDIPTRVETISASELDEKASMQPANAKMILT